MPEQAGVPSDADYTWLYSDGSGPVLSTDSHASQLIRNDKDAATLLRTIVKRIGLPAALRLLSEVAAELEGAEAAKKGDKK